MLGPLRASVLRALAVLLVLVAGAREARAQRLDPRAVPEPLRPWTAWVLHGKERALCPALEGAADQEPRCAWPSRLDLTLGEDRGTFEQVWHLEARGSVPLPGDAKRWPLDVTVNGKRAPVAARDGAPRVELEAGDHVVRGTFLWDSLPESLRIPRETALLGLTLRGKRVDLPHRDADGTVWLQKTLSSEEGERLELVVHRRVADEVPALLTTRVVLHVSGQSREVLLGKTLPEGFVPMALDSEIPARLEADTRLRVQVRPGTWTIELTARSEGPVAELKRPAPDGPWRDGEEVWVFDARTHLRLVDVEGVPAIDPQRTSLPEEWRRLPAYPVNVGDALRLVERRRGDAEPAPDHLTLERTLWLDFDGRAFTASDKVTGKLRRASRLEALAPMVLGRAAIGDRDQFITHLEGDTSKMGIEVRQGELDVVADSRILAPPSDLPAVGYNHDFRDVSATLNLPPGYRLLYASGVDDAPGTWLRHWTLLEIFLALVLAIGVFRLFGPAWGALALGAFVLLFPEVGAPKYLFVLALLVEALVRALDHAAAKAGTPSRGLAIARTLGRGARAGASVLLVLAAVSFMIDHIRAGVFPSLAEATYAGARVPSESFAGGLTRSAPERQEAFDAAEADVDDALDRLSSSSAPKKKREAASDSYRVFNTNVLDPSAIVQTGPGRPRWSFTSVPLRWSGPVERTQRLHLYLLSPPVNAALAVLRAVLLALLVLRLLPVRPRRDRGPGGRAVLAFGAAALALFLAPKVARADVAPPKEVLDELAARLLEAPACAPSCASSPRMFVEATKTTLRLRVEIEAAERTAVPLPSSAQWAPERVLLDGRPARALLRAEDGRLFLAVERGLHQAILEGPLSGRDTVQIALPLKPHRVEATVDGFRVEGIHEDGLADDNLQLARVREGAEGALEAGELPPFVRVERTLLLGLDWHVETRIVRLSPPGAAVVLEVPLLDGESVTTADVRVANGKIQLNMPPEGIETTFRSVLAPRSPIVLTAPRAAGWTELWRLDMSPVWHADFAGIPTVHATGGGELPEWRPWPGESATLHVIRPEGAAGSTLTIDESRYALRPGVRATDASLTLEVRSSRGTQHAVTLPEGSVLESVTINGVSSLVRQEGRAVSFPVAPGASTVVLAWRMPAAMRALFTAPELDLGAPSVNATTSISVPPSRWILALRGPRLGPVVLFWSLLAVLLAVAAAIGAMRKSPLAIWEWMLLAIGLSQVHVAAAAFVVGWFHLLAWRRSTSLGPALFNLRQLAIVLMTVIAAGVLLASVYSGLLGRPDMQIRGNGSYAGELSWFSDRSDGALAAPVVVSAPMFVYRGAMLGWALWLSLSVVRWLRWGFGAFAEGGFWRRLPRRPAPVPAHGPPPSSHGPPPPPAPPAPPTGPSHVP